MNVFLWVLQVLLALHSFAGAMWKFFNSEQAVPSLKALPHGVWLALSAFEILCGIGLILPAFNQRLSILASIAALGIAAEMALFSGLNVTSGSADPGEMIYWLVVAAVCAFIAYGRLVLRPIAVSQHS
jgi:DoxX-like protein